MLSLLMDWKVCTTGSPERLHLAHPEYTMDRVYLSFLPGDGLKDFHPSEKAGMVLGVLATCLQEVRSNEAQ